MSGLACSACERLRLLSIRDDMIEAVMLALDLRLPRMPSGNIGFGCP